MAASVVQLFLHAWRAAVTAYMLIDKGDFGSFTSQESALMIWGGLLYLTRLDFRTVYTLSRNRDQLLTHYPNAVRTQYYRYLPLKDGWQMRPLVKGFLDIYRVLGGLPCGAAVAFLRECGPLIR